MVSMRDARDLYGLPLERFVSERAALAKRLRSEGRREEATQVAQLRKPSIAGWAVNQLVRTQRRAVAELFESGDRLQRAQSELLAGGGDGRSLREAADRERAAVDALTRAAGGLLSSQGHELSGPMLERVRDTLHAAALDRDARNLIADGCLERELKHVGIGPSVAGAALKRSARERQLNAARAAAADANRAADRALEVLRAAQERRDRAVEALARAEAAHADARRSVEAAEAAYERAKTEQGRD
jgi:hypothetical protein